jgi:hypothetical protein
MRCFGGSRKWFFRICCAIVLFVSAAASVSGYYERWPFWTTAIAEGSTLTNNQSWFAFGHFFIEMLARLPSSFVYPVLTR